MKALGDARERQPFLDALLGGQASRAQPVELLALDSAARPSRSRARHPLGCPPLPSAGELSAGPGDLSAGYARWVGLIARTGGPPAGHVPLGVHIPHAVRRPDADLQASRRGNAGERVDPGWRRPRAYALRTDRVSPVRRASSA